MSIHSERISELESEAAGLLKKLNEANLKVSRLEAELESGNICRAKNAIFDSESKDDSLMLNELQMHRALFHELNQPLTVLLGCCELLAITPYDDPDTKNHISAIIASSITLSRIIEKMNYLREYTCEMNEWYLM